MKKCNPGKHDFEVVVSYNLSMQWYKCVRCKVCGSDWTNNNEPCFNVGYFQIWKKDGSLGWLNMDKG